MYSKNKLIFTFHEKFCIFRFTMEMHVVTKNSKYPSMIDALNNTDGLAVLAFFYDVSVQVCTNYLIVKVSICKGVWSVLDGYC